ncbi:MAG: ATP synthase subunit I [Actinomycetota bacterium]|nr:ATP synthase subunit I [Acidimicrobiia bacterium]MDQ3292882.1 ATP synthase subunit I [Actinomycetota bacterium]
MRDAHDADDKDPKAAAGAPAVEKAIAFDMLRRSVWLVPFVLIAATLIWGADGASSSAVAVGLVLVNLVLSALALSWAANVSLNAIMAVALGGFAVRMGLVTLVIVLVKDEPWIDLVALGVSVLVTHLGLLFWELRYVSASLAFPGLKPGTVKEARPS